MATATKDTADSGRPLWIVVCVGAVILILAALNLSTQVIYSVRATHQVGSIVATEGGIGRKRSVTANVSVPQDNAAPLTIEVEDTLGTHGWKPGDSIGMLCTRLHADHVSCVADLWLDRYAFSLGMLLIGALAVWAGLRRRGVAKGT
jgi:hypothetical protein